MLKALRILCESDCLEAVNLFMVVSTHVLHAYASVIIQMNICLVLVLGDQNRYVDFLPKDGSHFGLQHDLGSPTARLGSSHIER